ncbi:hypothetical protein KP509_36G012900 [Ceratopteris richardii]|uniref:Syntaxin 6/10/61 N-terminal domain-containing protein n=1 Tax=Ceratopteris richardii TaxID=49495 RepID=A0A8T2QAC3_CERRI|nr:hypothetical protein KP509_36G012900 [Ceratopteris richardii]
MTRNFHRWEVDPFFSAAEEVQNSADRLESVYRTWVHAKSVDDDVAVVEFHKRELNTALGTAKWQLEDFERAVSCVVVDVRDQTGDDAPSRHKQFVDALRTQISAIEESVVTSEGCSNPRTHQALNLREEEKDDLEMFLCGTRPIDEGILCNSASSKTENQDYYVGTRKHNDLLFHHPSKHASNSEIESRNPNPETRVCANNLSSSHKILVDLNDVNCENSHAAKVDEISKPVSDPTSEYFHSDRGDNYGEMIDGQHRSVSVASGLNSWRSGSVAGFKRKRRKPVDMKIISTKLGIWDLFAKACHPERFRSGLKRWKDGDANASDNEMLSLVQGACDIEQENGMLCFGLNRSRFSDAASCGLASRDIKHHRAMQEGLQTWQRTQHVFASSRLVQIASAVLVALGLVGLSFHVTSSAA